MKATIFGLITVYRVDAGKVVYEVAEMYGAETCKTEHDVKDLSTGKMVTDKKLKQRIIESLAGVYEVRRI